VRGTLEVRDGSVVRGAGGAALRLESMLKKETGASRGVRGEGGGELLPLEVELLLRRRVERRGRVGSGEGSMARLEVVRCKKAVGLSKFTTEGNSPLRGEEQMRWKG